MSALKVGSFSGGMLCVEAAGLLRKHRPGVGQRRYVEVLEEHATYRTCLHGAGGEWTDRDDRLVAWICFWLIDEKSHHTPSPALSERVGA